ncbi:hypothetical protein [Kitasatospora sp. NPDC001175]
MRVKTSRVVLVPTIELLEPTAASWSLKGGRRDLAVAACSRNEALETARIADLVASVKVGEPVTVYATYASPVVTDEDLRDLLNLPAIADLRSQRSNEELLRLAGRRVGLSRFGAGSLSSSSLPRPRWRQSVTASMAPLSAPLLLPYSHGASRQLP